MQGWLFDLLLRFAHSSRIKKQLWTKSATHFHPYLHTYSHVFFISLYLTNVPLFASPPWAWPKHGRCSWWCRWGWCPSCPPAGNPCAIWAWARRQPLARWWSDGSPASVWPAPSPRFCRSPFAQTPRPVHDKSHSAWQVDRSDHACTKRIVCLFVCFLFLLIFLFE